MAVCSGVATDVSFGDFVETCSGDSVTDEVGHIVCA